VSPVAACVRRLTQRCQDGAKEDKMTFNQREKRKRERGQATSGRNFVEEEKRVQRSFGQGGFD